MPNKRRSAANEDVLSTPHESPYSKRPRRSVVSVNKTELAQTIVDYLREAEDDRGRLICDHFIKLPSKRGNSDYYETVVEPIDLNKISQRVKMEEYRDLDLLTTDVQLMVSNAKMYYPEDSEQYKDACILLDTYFDIKARVTEEGGEGPSTSKVKKSASSTLDPHEVMKEVYESVVTETDEDGRVIAELFMKLPDQASCPGYYEVVKDPIDLRMVFDRIENKEYKAFTDMKKDIRLMQKNASMYNKPSSQVYQDALLLKKLFEERLSDGEKGKKFNDSSNTSTSCKTSARIKHRKSWARNDKTANEDEEPDVHADTITDASEDNYQARLYNEVLNYRNEFGHTICDPFMRLPNRRFYPTYYEEIENPISLKFIRKKVVSQKYQNVDEMNDDLQLLCDNAIHYNLPTAQIHKDANTLKEFINQRVPEYIEKEATTTPMVVGDHDLTTTSSSTIHEATNTSSTALPPVALDNSSNEENSSTKKKRRNKKKGGKSLQAHLKIIYETVMKATAFDGREMIALFLDKPSRKNYPDYYKLILEPIDMKMIDKKIRTDKYTSVDDMLEDFHLMFNNARHYNEPGSEVYLDANSLEKIMNEKVRSLGPHKDGNEDSFADEKSADKSITDEKSLDHKLEKLFVRVRDHVDVTNRSICDIFTHLPTRQELPDYYKVIKKPMDMERIQQKMQAGQYMKLEEMVQDMCLMFENACVYNEPGSVIYKDALILECLAVDVFRQIEPAVEIPDVQLLVHEIMCEIFTKVVFHQDENNRIYSESLFNSSSDDENNEPADSSILSLDAIKRNLRNRRYKRLDVFQEQLFSVFEDARSKNRTDSDLYEDVVELQKFYIKTRDELCKNGDVLMSPANEFTLQSLESELEVEKKVKLPDEAEQDKEIEQAGNELREKVEAKQHTTEAFKYEGEDLQVGDYVYVTDVKSDIPHIVLIEKLYDETKDSGEVERMMYGCWFFRPKATFHTPNKKFLLQEVFKTDFYNTVPVSTICGRCHVMSSKDYFKLKPVGFKHEDVYVCESRYSTRGKSFKRIKQTTSLAENNRVKLMKREKDLERRHVGSYFSGGSASGSPTSAASPEAKNDRAKLKDMLMNETDPKWPNAVLDVKRENTKSDTQNPNNEATYYTQYQYNGKWIKLGDCMYVQERGCPKTRIARIERLWTDGSGNVWFHGPWFVECNDTNHEPTRTFYKKELFLSSDEETIQMSHTIGKCLVLPIKDFQSSRPTEELEKEIYMFESRYMTVDQTIRKMKSLKRFQTSNKVVEDEVYYFRKPIDLDICVSNMLRSIVQKEVASRDLELKNSIAQLNQNKEMNNSNTAMLQQQAIQQQQNRQYGPFQQHVYQQGFVHGYNAVPFQQMGQDGQVQIAGHQQHGGAFPHGSVTAVATQSAVNFTPNRPPFPGNQQFSPGGFPASTPDRNNRTSTPSSSRKRKGGGGHSTGYILFASVCHPRVRSENPDLQFGEISKLVGEEWRNLKDEQKKEYEDKAKEQTARAEAEGRIAPKKSKKKKKEPLNLDDVAMSPASNSQDSRQGALTPGGNSNSNQGFPQQQAPTQQINNIQQQQQGGAVVNFQGFGGQHASQPAPPYVAPQAPPQITIQQQAATVNGIHVRKRGPLFVRPPPKPERVLMHSDAYFRYIDKLNTGSKSVGNWESALKMKESDVQLSREDEAKLPAEWLGLGKGKYESTKSALWSLRDLMLKDTLAMRNVMEWEHD